jgi:hypothetical protein
MKKSMFLLMVVLLMSVTAESQTRKYKHGYAEVISLSYLTLHQKGGSNINSVGVKVGGGFYPFGDMARLGIEVGIHKSINDVVIGSFSYTEEQGGTTSTHENGIIKREMRFVPILLNWSFESGTRKALFRIGPSIGFIPTFSKNSFEPETAYNKDYVNKQQKTPFVYGGNAELSFSVFELFKLNFGYKYLWFMPFTLSNDNAPDIRYDSPSTEMKLAGHQVSIGVLFVF